MSGQITNNVFRASGVIAPTAGGLSWSSAIITGSTVTVEASNGYWINTTSNACTVTLPSSAEIGDQIVLADYARTWSTNNVIIDSNGLNFQGDPDTYTVDYSTAGQSLSIVYSDATKGWVPISDDAVAKDHTPPPTQKAIFGYGYAGGYVSMSNLVSSSGVIATDVSGVGTARDGLAGDSYGGDKAIFGYGYNGGNLSLTNLVSSSGVVAADVSGVGTARRELAAAGYGVGLAIFGYGYTSTAVSLTNLVSYSGVVATDTSGVGTVRYAPAATRYGTDKAIFGYGSILSSPYYVSMTNLVSNVGVVATDVTGVGTTRTRGSATVYGSTGQAMFGYGQPAIAITNLITNVGVVGSDVSGVGTARWGLGGSPYGGDKAIFAYGSTGSDVSMSNLVNNVGVVASDVTGVGTARSALAAAGYSITA
tara:strand:- start:217 stop:1482 length:1266 start_codon:yes stop_codon:yes gene_type:complete